MNDRSIRRPFFSFYGGKWRATRHYPEPQHEHIIEPFAGGAGYALHYAHLRVTLYEIDPIVAGVWNYLIHATEREIRRLPLVFESLKDLRIPQEAKWLIGFWLGIGNHSPRVSPSTAMRKRLAGLTPRGTGGGNNVSSFWSAPTRETIATQLHCIRHWKVACKSYESAPNRQATWFIDPPYNCKAGRSYRYHTLDYEDLAYWCKDRQGQAIVCENAGAAWLPFKPLKDIRTVKGFSSEVAWCNAS